MNNTTALSSSLTSREALSSSSGNRRSPASTWIWNGTRIPVAILSYERIPPRYQHYFRTANARPEPGVLAWIEAADGSLLYLSVLTLGEIRRGAALLETWLEVELRARFAGRIVPIDAAIADRWGPDHGRGEAKRNRLASHQQLAGGDRASPQSDSRLAQRHRLYQHASAGFEPVGSVTYPRQAGSAFVEPGVPVMRRAPRLKVR